MKQPKLAVKSVKHFLNHSYMGKASKPPEGYTKEESMSGKRVQVYEKDGQAVVVHRGTAGMHDVLTDAKYAMFGDVKGKRFKHSKRIQAEAEAKYGAENTTAMGHSLGGALAEKTASKDAKVITFNKAAGLNDVGRKIKANQTDIRTKNDLVSLISTTQKHRGDRVVLASDSYDALAEHTVDTLDRAGDIDV